MTGCRLRRHKIGMLAVVAAIVFTAASSTTASARAQAHHLSWPTLYRVAHSSVRGLAGRRSLRDRALSPRARESIVGGGQIAITQAPWQVFVEAVIPISKTEDLVLLCGGSIIDETHVVTAGHCMFDPETGAKVPAEDVLVVAGTSNFEVAEPEEQAIEVESIRVHPDFDYSSGAGAPDDVAVLALDKPLAFDSSTQPIGLVAAGATPGEGAQVNLTGFGRETPNGKSEGPLHSLAMTVGFSRPCGGEYDAVFLCASATTGSGCSGDSGSGLTEGPAPTLVGVMDIVEIVSGESCRDGADNGFVNIAAPEIRDFIEGSETPPLAPRGGGAVIRAVTEAGHLMTCEAGSWSGSPTFAYAFVNSANQQTLQSGPSSTYQLTNADVGRTIYCQVSATNAGGTGLGRTPALSAVKASSSPPSSASTMGSIPPVQILPTPSFPSTITLGGSDLITAANGSTAIKLECEGERSCSGQLTLQAQQSAKKKRGRRASHTVTIAHVDFSIPAGQTTDVKLRLNGVGLALLKAARGKLAANLRIAQTGSGETETTKVHLIETVRRTQRHRRKP
jgi:Trypsin